MALSGEALRLTIIVSESDHHGSQPLFSEIVQRAHKAGMAGATALRGVESFGASSRLHTTRLVSLSEDLPVVVFVIDEPAKVRAFAAEVADLVDGGVVTLDQVEVMRHVGKARGKP